MRKTKERSADGVRDVIVVRLSEAQTKMLHNLTLKWGFLNDQETIRYLITRASGIYI